MRAIGLPSFGVCVTVLIALATVAASQESDLERSDADQRALQFGGLPGLITDLLESGDDGDPDGEPMNRKNAIFCDDPLATSCDHRGRTTRNERFKEYTPVDREELDRERAERDREREERRREREREREERENLFASIAGRRENDNQNQIGSGLFGLRTPPNPIAGPPALFPGQPQLPQFGGGGFLRPQQRPAGDEESESTAGAIMTKEDAAAAGAGTGGAGAGGSGDAGAGSGSGGGEWGIAVGAWGGR
ncbi:unnamed protein product [Vitrella brassicaformis CCMP3155]|uniref:Uncharacterized protein n=1 Tax=Vitrella brassicaformis (strain CCMP3155) TaxID=1169540 RepID=A0A0G4G5W8_VITBC|nr:unnamed protein product [Vitrella brassicaformis CCMP3155]|eukprot:CEM23792.1 unnamed protein product [Vitrella brassicaformis CCMP3155]